MSADARSVDEAGASASPLTCGAVLTLWRQRRWARDDRSVAVSWPRLLPGSLLASTVLAEIGAVVLSVGLEPAYDTWLLLLFSTALAGTGTLVLARHPHHLIGWSLLGIGVLSSVSDVTQGYGLRAEDRGWAHGPLAELVSAATWLPQSPLFVVIVLAFPRDRLDSRWTRVPVALCVLGVTLGDSGYLLDPMSDASFVSGTNPYAVGGPGPGVLYSVGMTLVVASLAVALVNVVVRFRRSVGIERQQLKWFVFASGFLVPTLALSAALWTAVPAVRVLCAVALTLWPVAIGAAVLHYRLYDVDLVISRTVSYLTLTVALATVYAGTVVSLGALVGRSSAWVTATATLLAALAVRLLHGRVQRLVDRRFRPERQGALAEMEGFLGELRHGRAEPEAVVGALRSALDHTDLEVHYELPGDATPEVTPPRELRDVRRSNALVARISWTPRDDADRALLADLLPLAALPIDMARLRVELRRQLDEVAASRARIAAVADEERRRIERDLHDGAQQRLVSIGLTLRHAQHQLASSPDEVGATLDGAVVEVTGAIEELRALAHGLRPASLEAGLGPALRDLASRSPLRVDVVAGRDRYPADVETAAYFVACEGLTNAVKHSRAREVALRVEHLDGTLHVSVADDGVGGASMDHGSGLTGLNDRVAAHGGRLVVDSVRGRGTTLSAELPCVS